MEIQNDHDQVITLFFTACNTTNIFCWKLSFQFPQQGMKIQLSEAWTAFLLTYTRPQFSSKVFKESDPKGEVSEKKH